MILSIAGAVVLTTARSMPHYKDLAARVAALDEHDAEGLAAIQAEARAAGIPWQTVAAGLVDLLEAAG